jgi:hypothetical protein
MADRVTRAKRRRWADVLIIVASVYALLAVVWSPPELYSGGDAAEIGSTDWLIASYTIGAVLGLGALLAGQKWTVLGRILAGVAGLVVLSGLLSFRELTALGLLSMGGTGLALLIAAPFMGPMPAPFEEKRVR